MASVPATARVVVIGAGIVGNSLVHHLARLGWTRHRPDRQGRAAEPGRLDRSRVELHLPGGPQPRDHGPDARQRAAVQGDGRLHRVRRLRGGPHRGADGGAAPPDVVGQGVGDRVRAGHAAEVVAEKVPFLDPDQIIGAFWTPSVGVVDSLRAGTIMREQALESGALTVVPTVEVIGLDVEDGRIRRVRTTRRRHRGRDRRDRLRRVEPEDRRHGRRLASRSPRPCTR